MSPLITATLIGGGLALLGTIVGMVMERFLRSKGRLRCWTTHGEVRFLPGYTEGDFGSELVATGEIVGVTYAFGLNLFNSKEIPVGLHDLSVVLVCDGGKLVDKPLDPASPKKEGGIEGHEPLHFVNLPPGQVVHVEILGRLSDVETAQTWRRVEFVGHRGAGGLFESEEFRETIKTR